MAVMTGAETAWLQKRWDKSDGRPSQIRHHHAHAPCQKGASNNCLLQCTKMSVKAKDVEDKGQQIRRKYGRRNLETELNRTTVTTAKVALHVTKVQIRKTQERAREKSEGRRASSRRKIDNEGDVQVHTSPRQSRRVGNETNKNADANAPTTDANTNSEQGTTTDPQQPCPPTSSSVDAISLHEQSLDLNVIHLQRHETKTEHVERLIQRLTRKLRDAADLSRQPFRSHRPTATYARPTKGEIALSLKGPVLLTPLGKASKVQANVHDVASRDSKLDPRVFREFAGSSDSVVLAGRQLHGLGRVSWSPSQRGRGGAVRSQCHSCRVQLTNSHKEKETGKAKSAAAARHRNQGKIHSGPHSTFRLSSTPARNMTNQRWMPKRGNPALKGLVSAYSSQVNLGQLNSLDHFSSVPPPSLSSSPQEDVSM